MTALLTTADTIERQDDFLALINMLGYAGGVAESLGVGAASRYIDVAKEVLQSKLQSEMGINISSEGMDSLSSARVGRC